MWWKTVVICTFIGAYAVHSAKFPDGFGFGTATSSYQIEGGWNADGKSMSIWDNFTHTKPDRVIDLSNGNIACDSYNNWQRDIEMAAEMNLTFYRFSLSWPRILPTGYPYEISEEGKNYYNNLINGLLAKKIEPIITLYHWDLPQNLQDLGGWGNPLIADWFADYARVVFNLYADRVKIILTLNEPTAFCDFSYNMGIHAPGLISTGIGSYLCNKHVLLAHAKAWRIYDKEFRPKFNGKIGLTNALLWLEAETPKEEQAAVLAREFMLGMYTYPIYSEKGGWPPLVQKHIKEVCEQEGWKTSRLPVLTTKEIELIRGTYDFVALNYYTARTVREAKQGEPIGQWPMEGNYDFQLVFSVRPEWQKATDWFYVYPQGLRKLLGWLREKFGKLPVYITENGYADIHSGLEDVNRVKYMRDHLEQVLLSIYEDDVDVKCYTAWSLMDNFEWAFGYTVKFGLYEVDFKDPRRTRRPRASAKFYKKIIQSRELDIESDNKIKEEL